jgi:hypothetical protein
MCKMHTTLSSPFRFFLLTPATFGPLSLRRSRHLRPRLSSSRIPPAVAPPPALPLRARQPRPQRWSLHAQPARMVDRDGGDTTSGGGHRTSNFLVKSTTPAPPPARISSAFCSSPLLSFARISSAAAWWQAAVTSSYSPHATVERCGVLRSTSGRRSFL